MKGRHTSFQRFGSGSHNPFGSVLNKYFLTSDTVRKNNIYEKTFSGRNIYGEDFEDLGEEVFGCIAKGINTQGHLEGDTDEMTSGRKQRKDVEQYKLGSEGSILRSWKDENNKSYEDSVLIPQESLPLNVISKYPIKYSYDTYDDNDQPIVKDVDVPPSAGFSGPYLYRPKKFPSSFTPTILKEDCIVNSNFYGRPVTPVSIPSDVAHQILNCTKEIKFTGDLDHSIEGSNKKCSGSSSLSVTQTYYLSGGCPGTTPIQKTRKANYECTSVEEKVTLQVKGSISGTLSRYNILTSLWDEPVKLDLSPNFYQGSNAAKAYNFFATEGLYCDFNDSGPGPDERDYLKVKMLGDREKVTKLDAGCAVTPTFDIDIIRRDQGKNLLETNANVSQCENDGGKITKGLMLYPEVSRYLRVLLGDKNNPSNAGTLPAGPSLYGDYSAGLAQYVGLEGSEKVFESTNCSANELESFRSPAGAPLKTGLEVSMTGGCVGLGGVAGTNAFSLSNTDGISVYDATDRDLAYYQWADKDGCYGEHPGCCPSCSVYGEQGTYYLDCQKERQCYKDGSEEDIVIPRPSGSGYPSKCAAPFGISFDIARYAEVGEGSTFNGMKYANAEVIPLDVQAKATDKQDLCLGFVFSGVAASSLAFPDTQGYPQVPDYYLRKGEDLPIGPPVISPCKLWHDTDVTGGSVVSVGSRTLKAGDWSTAIPLYTTHHPREAKGCVGLDVGGIEGPRGWITACKRTTSAECDGDCDCCASGGAGCGSQINTAPCNERVDCEPKKCTYSYSSSYNEDCPQTAICVGCQDCYSCDGDCDLCACCGCNCDCDPGDEGHENPCPPYIPIPPTTYTGAGKMGCYGDGYEKETLKTTCNITLEFIPFDEAGGVKQT